MFKSISNFDAVPSDDIGGKFINTATVAINQTISQCSCNRSSSLDNSGRLLGHWNFEKTGRCVNTRSKAQNIKISCNTCSEKYFQNLGDNKVTRHFNSTGLCHAEDVAQVIITQGRSHYEVRWFTL